MFPLTLNLTLNRYLDGGFPAWQDAGFPTVKTNKANIGDLLGDGFFFTEDLGQKHSGKFVYLDVRSEGEWRAEGVLEFSRLIEVKNILRSDYVSLCQE